MSERDSSKKARSSARASSIILLVIWIGAFSAGCEVQERAPSSEPELLEEAAEVEEIADLTDSVEVIDDERSVEDRIRDASTASQIRLALVETPELKTFDFDPVVVDGRVHLRGTVLTASQRERAAEVARGVKGVRDLTNEVVATEAPLIAEDSKPDQAESPVPDSGGRQAAEPRSGADDASGSAETQEPATATYHTVRSGENLWVIARQYDVSIEQIQRLNGLGSSSIKPGQRLRIE